MICEDGTSNLKNSQTRSSSCQCSMTSIGQEEVMMEFVFRIQKKVTEYAKRFSRGHWTFLGPGDEKKWYGTLPCTFEGKWNFTATRMVERFNDTGHPVFKSIRALSRGILKKKNGRDTIHFNADASNTELLFRMIHSVNQLSIYGAVTKWCKQFGLTEEEKGKERQKESVTKHVLSTELLRSKTFGIASKTSIRKHFARKYSGLRITDRENSIHKGLRIFIVPAPGISWDELQNST